MNPKLWYARNFSVNTIYLATSQSNTNPSTIMKVFSFHCSVRKLGHTIAMPIFIAFVLSILLGNTVEFEKIRMKKGSWTCPEGTEQSLASSQAYFHRSMPTFSQISGTSNTFSAAIWRMAIGAVSGLRIFVLPLIYYNEFNNYQRYSVALAAIGEAVGIMGLTYTFTMSPNTLFEAMEKFDPTGFRNYFWELTKANDDQHLAFLAIYVLSVVVHMYSFSQKYRAMRKPAVFWLISVVAYLSLLSIRKVKCMWYIWGIAIIGQYSTIFLTIYFSWRLLVVVLGDKEIYFELRSKPERPLNDRKSA